MSIENEVFSYHKYDGSIEFFFRLSCFIDRNHKVLDLGAGRGSWFYEDPSYIRKSLRNRDSPPFLRLRNRKKREPLPFSRFLNGL